MSECHSPWRERLSEHLDGELAGEEREGIERHLASCASCARALDDLRAVVRRARTLEDRPPTRDLWPGIEAAIAEGGSPGRHVEPPRAPAGSASETFLPEGWASLRKTVRVTLPQLAAAAVLVMILSGGGAWLLLRGPEAGGSGAAAVSDGFVRTVAEERGAPDAIAPELAELEGALKAARDELDPATVRILEKNLAVIDRAIADSRRALELDPANPFLERHLDRAYRRKLEYLREAAAVAEWSS